MASALETWRRSREGKKKEESGASTVASPAKTSQTNATSSGVSIADYARARSANTNTSATSAPTRASATNATSAPSRASATSSENNNSHVLLKSNYEKDASELYQNARKGSALESWARSRTGKKTLGSAPVVTGSKKKTRAEIMDQNREETKKRLEEMGYNHDELMDSVASENYINKIADEMGLKREDRIELQMQRKGQNRVMRTPADLAIRRKNWEWDAEEDKKAVLDLYRQRKNDEVLALRDRLTLEEQDELDNYVASRGVNVGNSGLTAKEPDFGNPITFRSAKDIEDELALEYLRNKEDELRARPEPTAQEILEKTGTYRLGQAAGDVPLVGGVLGMATDQVMNFGSAIATPIEGVTNFARQIANPYRKLGPHEYRAERASQGAMRSTNVNVARTLDRYAPNAGFMEEGSTARNISDFWSGAVSSTTQSIGRMLGFGAGSLAMAGMSSANNELYNNAGDDSVSARESLTSATLHGVAEAAFETISFGNFKKMQEVPVRGVKDVLTNLLRTNITNGTEEMFTEIANKVTDQMVKGEADKEIATLMRSGYSEEEARKTWFENALNDVMNAGLAGMAQGTLMGGAGSYISTLNNGRSYSDVLQEGGYSEIAESIDDSTAEGQVVKEMAERYAERVENGGTISTLENGYLANAIDEAMRVAGENTAGQNETSIANYEDVVNAAGDVANAVNTTDTNENAEPDAARRVTTDIGQRAMPDAYSNIQNDFGVENITQEENSRNHEDIAERKRYLVEEFAKNYDDAGRNALVDAYDGVMSPDVYAQAMNDVYNMARYAGEGKDESVTARSAMLTREQRLAAYKAGVEDWREATDKWDVWLDESYKARQEARVGGVVDHVPEASKNLITTLEALGKKTGLIFYVTNTGKYQGKYDRGSGVITIDLASQNPLATVSHEMTHWIKDYAPLDYMEYRLEAIGAIVKGRGVELDSLIKQYRARYGSEISNDEIMDEIFADSTGYFLNDETFINEVVSQNRSLAGKILDWIKSVRDAIKSLISDRSLSRAAESMRQDLALYEKARDQWVKAIDAASEKFAQNDYVASDSELHQAIDNAKDKSLKERLREIKRTGGRNFETSHLYLRETPKNLSDLLGIRELPMLITSKHAYTALLTEEKSQRLAQSGRKLSVNEHGLTVTQFTAAVDAIENPAMVIKSVKEYEGERAYDVILMTDVKDGDGNPIMIALKVDGKGNYNDVEIDTNLAKSIYGKERIESYIKRAHQEGRILSANTEKLESVLGSKQNLQYQILANENFAKNIEEYKKRIDEKFDWNKKKHHDLRTPRLQLPNNSQVNDASNEKISQESESVKGQDKKNKKNELFQLLDIDEGYRQEVDPLTENQHLRAANNYLTEMLYSYKDLTPSVRDTRKIARAAVEEFGSSISVKKVSEQLQSIYSYIRRSQNIDGGQVMNALNAVANEIIDGASYTDKTAQREWDNAKKTLRSYKIFIPESSIADLSPDGFGALRKRYFGYGPGIFTRDGSKGQDASEVYQELHNSHPDIWTKDPADLWSYSETVEEIFSGIESMRPRAESMFSDNGSREEASFALAQQFMDEYFNVGSESMKSEYLKGVEQIRGEYESEVAGVYEKKFEEVQKDINTYKKNIDQKFRDYQMEVEARYDSNLRKVREEANQTIKERTEWYNRNKENMTQTEKRNFYAEMEYLRNPQRQHREALRANIKEAREQSENTRRKAALKDRIVRDSRNLTNMLMKPTDSKHIPKAFANSTLDILESIDFGSQRLNREGEPVVRQQVYMDVREKINTLQSLVREAESNNGLLAQGDGGAVQLIVDPAMLRNLETLKNSILPSEGETIKNIDEMDVRELETVRDTLASLKKLIEDANDFITNRSMGKVSELADTGVEYMRGLKSFNSYTGPMKAIHRVLNEGMLDSYTYFWRMGDTGKALHEMTNEALNKNVKYKQEIQEGFDAIVESAGVKRKELRQWQNEKKKVKIGGDVAEMTTAQIMSLYLLDKRGQARKHMYSKVGGIELSAIKKGKTGLTLTDSSTVYKVTRAEVKAITDTLTGPQRAVADGIARFLMNNTSRWGNETSMQMYGYEKFKAKDYFPIMVDRDSLELDSKAISDGMELLKSMGSTKTTSDQAANPLIVGDVFTTFMSSADKMASYSAYVPVIADLQKWYNYKDGVTGVNIRKQIGQTFGKDGQIYYEDYLRDLNGKRGSASDWDNALYNMAGVAKGAAVGANLRVAIQQPTAIVRAAAVIEARYLPTGMTLNPKTFKDEYESLTKYAPIAVWKEIGGFDVNIGRSMDNMLLGEKQGISGKLDTIREKSMIFAEYGDKITWTWIWRAAQNKIADTTDLQRGSEEFYKESAKLFEDIVHQTQVVDSVNTRTDLMKSSSALVKGYTSFMSEPSKKYNVMYRSIYELWQKWDTKERGAASKNLAKTLLVLTAGDMVTAALASLITAMRRRSKDKYKDKEFADIYTDAVMDDFLGNINPLGMLPIAKDIVSMIEGYDVTDMNYQWVTVIKEAVEAGQDIFSGNSKGGIVKNLQTMSRVTDIVGVPLYNFTRDVGALVDTFVGANDLDTEWTLLNGEKNMSYLSDARSYSNMKSFLAVAMKAYAQGDSERGDRFLAEIMENTDEDKVNTAIANYLTKDEIYLDYKENGGDVEQVREELLKKGYPEEIVDKKLGSATKGLQAFSSYEDLAKGLYEGTAEKVDIESYIEYKRNVEGKSDEDIRKATKSALTRVYKSQYQEGSKSEKNEIIKTLQGIKFNGEILYDENDFKRWNK